MASDGPPEKKRKCSHTSGEPGPTLQQNDFIFQHAYSPICFQVWDEVYTVCLTLQSGNIKRECVVGIEKGGV